jgi:predicted ATPase
MPLVREVTLEGFKSVRKLELELGRVNVLIGANGAGKSNVLEGIAYGVAGAYGKLDNEYLVPRGIRVTEPAFMAPAFSGSDSRCRVTFRQESEEFVVVPTRVEALRLERRSPDEMPAAMVAELHQVKTHIARLLPLLAGADLPNQRDLRSALEAMEEDVDSLRALAAHEGGKIPREFLIYAPENSALRIFQAEPQILPLGVRGEGLFAHLKRLGEHRPERLESVVEHLSLLDWFETLQIPKDLAAGERSLRIRDRYLAQGALFDQRSANEGFLFLLFYLTLFVSDETPAFFAIDNVDTALNPKLATATVRKLVELAREHDKQVIFTTHSPAVLDALDLHDDEQRLLVVDRDVEGATVVRRVSPPKPLPGDSAVPLSEAFVRGYLGGLPEHF